MFVIPVIDFMLDDSIAQSLAWCCKQGSSGGNYNNVAWLCRIFCSSKKFEKETTDVEPWYGTLYSVEKIDDMLVKVCAEYSLLSEPPWCEYASTFWRNDLPLGRTVKWRRYHIYHQNADPCMKDFVPECSKHSVVFPLNGVNAVL